MKMHTRIEMTIEPEDNIDRQMFSDTVAFSMREYQESGYKIVSKELSDDKFSFVAEIDLES